ncbi:ice-binding family protein [Undibacterium arcticum]
MPPDFTELGAGEIGGLTLAPGLYKWGTDLLISTDVTLSGGPNDVWIFQVAGQLNQANATRVTLAGGALAKNIFWQVADNVSIGTTAHFEGVVLAKNAGRREDWRIGERQTVGTNCGHSPNERCHTTGPVRTPGAPWLGPRRRQSMSSCFRQS